MLARKFGRIAAVAAVCVAMRGASLHGQEQKKSDPAADLAAWEEMQKPGPEHEVLKKMVGEWTAEVTTTGPDGTSMKSTGKESSKMILGGRFIESHYSGTMMGKAYEGRSLIGYDRMMKKYVNTWADSMSTGVMVFYGDASKDGKVLTLHCERIDAGGKPEKWKSVTTLADDKTVTFDMSVMLPDAKEMKVLSIVYKKVN